MPQGQVHEAINKSTVVDLAAAVRSAMAPKSLTQPDEIRFGSMDNMARDDDLREAELAAVEARTDTKIVRMEGKIDAAVATLVGEIRAITGEVHGLRGDIRLSNDYNRNTRWIIAGLIVAGLGVFAAFLAWGGDQFSRGLTARDAIMTTIKDYEKEKRAAETPPPATKGR
jgi:hypothetical protein